MRILELDRLPHELLPQLAAFGVSDGDPPQDIALIRRLRRLGHPASDYWGVYAVEGDQVLSRVETLQLTFRGRAGSQTVVGISDVLTRPAGVGRGFARALLNEIHRREVERGRAWSFLWTHRTWGAHRLYEELGYRDVYSPPNALHRVPESRRRSPPIGYHWSSARTADAGRLERLLAEGSRHRVGFIPRHHGSARIRFRLGWRKPENHRILWHGARAVGYAHLSDYSDWNLSTNEVVVTNRGEGVPMLDALEGLARGRWLTLQGTSFVRDYLPDLRARGYILLPSSHTVLMAKRLRTRRPVREDLRTCFGDGRFSSHRGDMF